MTELRADISQHYALKQTLEEIFGKDAWYDLKECTSLSKWKKRLCALLAAIKISIHETVRIADPEWFEEADALLERGNSAIKIAKSSDELFSTLSAFLIRLAFHQIGFIPRRITMKKVTLAKAYWRLDLKRSVQYVQTLDQARTAEQQRKRQPGDI
jgi:hypothetical protein